MLISETKIDDSFPKSQFLIDGFSAPYRLDQNYKGGGLMLFVREDIPSNLLTSEEKPIESFYVEGYIYVFFYINIYIFLY